MKKLTRVGILILVIGASLLLGTILRGSSPNMSMTFGGPDTSPGSWDLYQDIRFPPRMLTLEVKSNVTSDVYILDQTGINLWVSNRTITPVLSLTDVKQESLTKQIGERGVYGILIHNSSNDTGTVKAIVMLYGLEQDLLYGSIIIMVTGLIIFIASSVVSVLKKENIDFNSKLRVGEKTLGRE